MGRVTVLNLLERMRYDYYRNLPHLPYQTLLSIRVIQHSGYKYLIF